MKRWSAKFDWPARVAAHAAHLAVVERGAIEATARGKAAEWEKRETQLRETEWSMHERAIAAAKRGLDAYMEKDKVYANLADIARMLEIASKLGRLATGLGQPMASGAMATICRGCASRSRSRWKKFTGRAEDRGCAKPCRCCRKKPHDALGTLFSGRSPRWLSDGADGQICQRRRDFAGTATGRVRCGATVRCTGRADGNWLRRRSRRREIALAARANGRG